MKIYDSFKKYCKLILEKTFKKRERDLLNETNRKKLKNKSFTILSQNCNGGVIYHDLGLKFLSPTINLYMDASDFVKFLKNLDYYIGIEPKKILLKENKYPVMLLDDIKIYCVHYKSFEQAVQKWNERKKRIDKNNLFIMMNERDNCSYNDIVEFDKLDYNNKVIFVKKEMPEIKSAYYIIGTEEKKDKTQGIIPLVKYKSIFSGRRYIDEFDYVAFFNEETRYNKRMEDCQ